MGSRRTKPIRLKAAGRERGSTVSEMLVALEDKAPSKPVDLRKPAIWTQEFLASGKVGKSK